MAIPPGPCAWTCWNLHPAPGCYFSTCIRSGVQEESGVPESAMQMVCLDLSICWTVLATAAVSETEDMLAVWVCPHLSLSPTLGTFCTRILSLEGVWSLESGLSALRRHVEDQLTQPVFSRHQSGRNQAGI